MTAFEELQQLVNFAGEEAVAREPGWQPSGGFIAAALATLRNSRP